MLPTQAAEDQQPAPTQASHSSSYRIKSVEENIWHVKKPCHSCHFLWWNLCWIQGWGRRNGKKQHEATVRTCVKIMLKHEAGKENDAGAWIFEFIHVTRPRLRIRGQKRRSKRRCPINKWRPSLSGVRGSCCDWCENKLICRSLRKNIGWCVSSYLITSGHRT